MALKKQHVLPCPQADGHTGRLPIYVYAWKLSSMQQLAAGALSRHPADCGMRSTVLGCLDTGTECHCQQTSMCTAAGLHFSSRPTDLGSTPLGNMEKSVRAVNTLATSETDFPMGPPISLFRTRGMIPALKQRSTLRTDRQRPVSMRPGSKEHAQCTL